MKTSLNGIELIKKYEGFRAEAYKCPAGKWTVGYGHTRTASIGQTITEKDAEELLKSDLEISEWAVNHYVKVPLNQNQFDALVSFVFNIGYGNFKKSSLIKFLNLEKYDLAKNEFHKWRMGGGKVLPGLVKRRAAEAELFGKAI